MKRNGIEEQYVIDDFTSKDTWRIFRIMAEFVEGFETLAKIPPAVAIVRLVLDRCLEAMRTSGGSHRGHYWAKTDIPSSRAAGPV